MCIFDEYLLRTKICFPKLDFQLNIILLSKETIQFKIHTFPFFNILHLVPHIISL